MDQIDRAIVRALQQDSSLSQRGLAEKVGLSQNACWRRLNALRASGVIEGETVRLSQTAIGLGVTVFVMVRTRYHSREWLSQFREAVLAIPNIVDFHRLAGDYDYMLKVVAKDMNAFDRIYQMLISKVELDTVTSYLSMEAIADNRDMPV
ncbi:MULTISPECIES: Lrp/AsnC family transcriptional regulator [Asaia]|uniref:Transcriptional regulator n=1 Tax=Asaia bogorensis NBRC 16594 TaxID=1231624 RepID=A0AAN4U170_9PROT|nr:MULTISPECIES: Lrp/AsnC family transcriptional regulator [Asaia]NIE79577.1 Lrp/AsnC family transcriptional regulator [Asaia sp. As-1742]BAT20453.1 transcriptional regulator Lrp/AsnC [Asaia bogorensis NBRC 16594]GBQ79276.1 AsnC family transcriptional regulator [Asaia bogorensis NBRC 16594]GEL52124.1 transcriptional regulator [Asaia bogorensis NBRC 16594]